MAGIVFARDHLLPNLDGTTIAMQFIRPMEEIFPLQARMASVAGTVIEGVSTKPGSCSLCLSLEHVNLSMTSSTRKSLARGHWLLGAAAVHEDGRILVRHVAMRFGKEVNGKLVAGEGANILWPSLGHRPNWKPLGDSRLGTFKASSSKLDIVQAALEWVLADDSPEITALRADRNMQHACEVAPAAGAKRPAGL